MKFLDRYLTDLDRRYPVLIEVRGLAVVAVAERRMLSRTIRPTSIRSGRPLRLDLEKAPRPGNTAEGPKLVLNLH